MLTPQQNDQMVVVGLQTESAMRPGKYGPGHEKHPSWPMPASEDVPLGQRGPQTGTSYRSKSWTDQTNYAKEPVASYTKPFMLKKQPRPLKTVMEKSEKLQTENFFQRHQKSSAPSLSSLSLSSSSSSSTSTSTSSSSLLAAKQKNHKFGPKTRSIDDYLYADLDLHKPPSQKLPQMIAVSDPSPQHYNCPYQDVMVVVRNSKKPKPQPQHLTQADLDAYTKSYERQKPRQEPGTGPNSDKSYFVHSKQHSIGSYSSSSGSSSGGSGATNSAVLLMHQHHHHHHHQKQSSYAQSEGYHSYVSSITDSSSVSTSLSTPTPFLDRLRRDTDAVLVTQTKLSKSSSLCDTEGRDSVVTNSSGSGSSNDTLKWHGSLSDVSTMSGSFGRDPDLIDTYDSGDFLLQQQQQQQQPHQQKSANSQDHLKHLIAHSSKVQAPQKHHSESVRLIESTKTRTNDSRRSSSSSSSSSCTSSGDDDDSGTEPNNTSIDRQRCFAFNRKSMRKIRTKNNDSDNSVAVADDEAVRKLRLFPVSTYTVRPQTTAMPRPTEFYPSARSSVAERINDIELKQSATVVVTTAAGTQPITSVPITTNYVVESPQLESAAAAAAATSSPPPPPLPPPLKPKSIVPTPILPRRSASYSLDLVPQSFQQHSSRPDNNPSPKCAGLIGPVICGPAISVDDWVPERPPKNPALLKQIYKEMNMMRVSQQQQQQQRNSCSTSSTSSNGQVSGTITSSDSSSTIVGQHSDDNDNDNDRGTNDVTNIDDDNDECSDQKRSLSMTAGCFGSQTNTNRVQYKTSNKKSLLATSVSLSASSALSSFSSSSSSSSSSSMHYATATTLSNSHLANGVYKRTISPQNRPSPPPPTRSNRHPYPTATLTTSQTDRKDFTKPSSVLISAPSPAPKLIATPSTTTTSTTTTIATTTATLTTPPSDTTSNDCVHGTHVTDDCSCSDEPTTGTVSSTSGCDTSLGSSSSSSTSSSFKSRSNSLQNSPILTNRQSKNDAASQTDDSMIDCDKKLLSAATAASTKTKKVLQQKQQPQQPYPQSALKLSFFDDKLPSRKKFPEEIDCETLSLDLINHLSSSDRLKCILTPVPESKKISDYISGLYRTDIINQPLKSSLGFQAKQAAVTAAAAIATTTDQPTKVSSLSSSTTTSENQSFSVATTSNPVFLAASESKAKILSKLNYNFNEYKITQDTKYLQKKKMELMTRLNRKLDVLRIERKSLEQECVRNDSLGANITTHLTQYATGRELLKYQMFIEEIDKITNLLLSLTLRLVRTENIILISECANEKKTLEEKRSKLHEQLKDAKQLKESIQRKSLQITKMLNKYLNNDELCDYNHFVNWKAKLIIEIREINDKIELSENQLQALKSSLTTTSL